MLFDLDKTRVQKPTGLESNMRLHPVPRQVNDLKVAKCGYLTMLMRVILAGVARSKPMLVDVKIPPSRTDEDNKPLEASWACSEHVQALVSGGSEISAAYDVYFTV